MSQVTSYTMANQAGALFRTQLNEVINSILTAASGTSPPAETHPYMFWVDTSDLAGLRVLRMRNAANTDWIVLPISVGVSGDLGPNPVTVTDLASDKLVVGDSVQLDRSGVDLRIMPDPYAGDKGVAMNVATGVMRSLAGGWGFPDGSLAPTAGIIQIKTAVKTAVQQLVPDGSWLAIDDLSVSITPQSAQSSFIILASVAVSCFGGTGLRALACRRDGDVIAAPTSPGNRTPCDAVLFNEDVAWDASYLSRIHTPTMLHFDSPATASSIVYDVAAFANYESGSALYVNRRTPVSDPDTSSYPRLQSRLIVAEIGGDLSA